MPLTTSSVTPLIMQTSRNYHDDRNRMIVSNSYESVIHEPPSRVTRSYSKPTKPKYQYTIEQVSLISNSSYFYVVFRMENHTVVVNGVVIGAPVIVECVIVVIEYLRVHCCFIFSLDYFFCFFSLRY